MTPPAVASPRSPAARPTVQARAGWRWGLVALVLAGAPVYSKAADAAAQRTREYDLKAVFLFNFAQFIDWPPEAFASPEAPFIIGVFGADPFGRVLDEVVQNEAVNGRPFVVQRYATAAEIGRCHILFVPGRDAAAQAAVLTRLAGQHVLTVGEVDDFVLQGGAVTFRTENRRVRLRINLHAARAANLTISSKLLRAAEIMGAVRGRRQPPWAIARSTGA